MISIVEPYWEREEVFDKQLETFHEHYRDRTDIELIVVDDGSPTQPARPVVEKWEDKVAWEIILIENPMRAPTDGKDPCVPMNQAIQASHGEFILMSQADILHKYPMIDSMLELMESLPQEAVLYPCTIQRSDGSIRVCQFTPSPLTDCMLTRRSVLDDVGGWSEDYRDGFAFSDTDLIMRMSMAGAKFVCISNKYVSHDVVPSNPYSAPEKQTVRNRNLMMDRFREFDISINPTCVSSDGVFLDHIELHGKLIS